MTSSDSTKQCSKCKQHLPHSSFSKDRTRKDGLQYRCRACDSAKRAALCERHIAARIQNPVDNGGSKRCPKCERCLPRSSFYSKRGTKDGLQDRCKACSKAANKVYRDANCERVAKNMKAWRADNPGKMRALSHRRRARKRNAEGTHTAEQVAARFAYHGNRCVYCGATGELHADHYKPLAKGGSNWPANIVPACPPCNISKQDKWGDEFKAWLTGKYC